MERVIKSLEAVDRSMTFTVKQIKVDPLIKLKKYTQASTKIGPGLNKQGKPVTGLMDSHTTLAGEKIEGTRRQMEEMLKLPVDTLASNSDYWHEFFVRVGADDLKLDLSIPEDLLQYLFLRAQTIVAIGLKEAGSKSKHEFVLFSEDEEAQLSAKQGSYKRTAYRLADDLDSETKAEILSIYGIIVDATRTSMIETKINEKIEQDAKKFLTIADDPSLKFKAVIRRCLDAGVLHLEDGVVKHGEVEVGITIPLAAQAISKNKPLETILKAKLSGDMEVLKKALAAGKIKK